MNKQGKLSRWDMKHLIRYTNHLKAAKNDVKTIEDMLDEFEWLVENGYCRKIKKDVYWRTKTGERLLKVINELEPLEREQSAKK